MLHYVLVPLEVAIARAERRAVANVAGAHRLDATGQRHFATIFEAPTADEGLQIILVQDTGD